MKKRNDENLAVPMSQMIDVVFLLLIYFVVTMKDEISEAHLAINLPSAGAPPAAASAEELKVIKIFVERTGYSYQLPPRPRRAVSAKDLETFLETNKDKAAKSDLIISVSPLTSMQQLVTVLDFAAKNGYSKLNVLRANE
ncbi:MAG: ExbD/TolR family protein [Oligosphaeraceae bacterium]